MTAQRCLLTQGHTAARKQQDSQEVSQGTLNSQVASQPHTSPVARGTGVCLLVFPFLILITVTTNRKYKEKLKIKIV